MRRVNRRACPRALSMRAERDRAPISAQRTSSTEYAAARSTRSTRGAILFPEPLVLAGELALWNTHDLVGIGDGMADALRNPSVLLQDRQRRIRVGGIDYVAEADAHVEDFVHLAVVDLCQLLDEPEDRLRLDQAVDLEADGGGDAREVQEAIAGDVDQRLHAGDLLQDFQRLRHVDVGRAQQLLADRR